MLTHLFKQPNHYMNAKVVNIVYKWNSFWLNTDQIYREYKTKKNARFRNLVKV